MRSERGRQTRAKNTYSSNSDGHRPAKRKSVYSCERRRRRNVLGSTASFEGVGGRKKGHGKEKVGYKGNGAAGVHAEL